MKAREREGDVRHVPGGKDSQRETVKGVKRLPVHLPDQHRVLVQRLFERKPTANQHCIVAAAILVFAVPSNVRCARRQAEGEQDVPQQHPGKVCVPYSSNRPLVARCRPSLREIGRPVPVPAVTGALLNVLAGVGWEFLQFLHCKVVRLLHFAIDAERPTRQVAVDSTLRHRTVVPDIKILDRSDVKEPEDLRFSFAILRASLRVWFQACWKERKGGGGDEMRYIESVWVKRKDRK